MTQLFGTNGIRGIIGEDMSSGFAHDIGRAWGSYLQKTQSSPHLAIATDARLSNQMIKSALISGLLSTGVDVTDCGLAPTPALQYAVHTSDEFSGGIIITASHNPPEFNGIKGVDESGTELTKTTEEEIEKHYFSKDFHTADWKSLGKYCINSSIIDRYIDAIIESVDVDLIAKQKFHVVLDCGNGAGSVATPALLKKLGCKVTELNCIADGTFPAHPSEPLPENLSELIETVPKVKADVGVAQDGDADRAIFVDHTGTYLWGDKTLSVVAEYLTKDSPNQTVATPVTTSSCLADVVAANNCTLITTKVGSPIVAREMIKHKCIFGGEENGGLIFPSLHYCRDSAMSIAVLLEIMAKSQKSLKDLVLQIPVYEMFKTKMPCPNEKKRPLMDAVKKQLKTDPSIIRIDETDGIKFYLETGWVLMRPSGTEPLFRIYSEAKDARTAKDLARAYQSLASDLISQL